MGPGGTGKTAVLKTISALIDFFAGAASVHKLAPSNAAARLLGGDTLHALCKLPFGKSQLNSKKGRLAKTTLRRHQQKWKNVVAAFLDEISMVPGSQLLHCDVRMRQATMRPNARFGGLAMNFCGDFLQLPPVDKDGTRKSLACPLDESGKVPLEIEEEDGPPAAVLTKDQKEKQQASVESRQGFELWRSVRRVVCLSVNVRAPGVLSRMLSEMRDGHISDEMWSLYLSRVLVPDDERLRDPSSPFCQHPVTFIVHRHSIRAMRSMENAREESRQLQVPLYLVQAHDEAVRVEERDKLTPSLRA